MGLMSARKTQRGVGIVPILIVVALVAAAVAFFMFKKPSSDSASVSGGSVSTAKFVSSKTLAAILPQETVAFYTAQDFEGTWKSFKDSNFWKKLSALPFWTEVKFEDALSTFKKDLEQGLGFEITEDRVLELVGKEFAIAVMPPDTGDQVPQVMFLLKTGMKAKVVDSIARLVDSKKNDPRLSRTNYEGVDVILIKPENPRDPEVRYFFSNDILTFAVGKTENSLKKMIDVATGKSKQSLTADKNYQDMTDMLGGAKGVIGTFFVDMGKVITSIGAMSTGAQNTQEIAATLGSLRMIGGLVSVDRDFNVKILVVPNREKMDGAIAALWDAKPADAMTLKMIPSGALVVSTSTTLEIAKLWDTWKKGLNDSKANPGAASVLTGIQQMEKDYNISIEKDVVSWIGNEVSFVFSDIDVTGLFPIPRLSLMVKVTDEAKAKAFMDKLVEIINKSLAQNAGGIKLELSDRAYGDVTQKVMQLPVLPGLMPGFAFVNGYLVITSSAPVMDAMIDAQKGSKDSMAKDANFQRMKDILGEKSNQIAYLNSEKFMGQVVDVLRWVIQYQNAQQTGTEGAAAAPAGNAQIEALEKQVIPVVEVLKSIKAVGMSTAYTKDGIAQNIRISYEDK